MRPRPVLLGGALALLAWCVPVAQAQLPPPLPSLPDNPYASCVSRYGHTGCAARLYAQLLCDNVGRGMESPELLEQRLSEQYELAAIDFRGITPEQVETAAVRYYSPMLCPDQSERIQRLFNPP